jgi:serine protease Do
MRASRLSPIWLFVLIAAAPAAAQEMQCSRSALVQSLLPTVVNLTAVIPTAVAKPGTGGTVTDPGLESSHQKEVVGSGFVISSSGELVTNYHVIDGAYEIIATFSDGTQLNATVAAADRVADIALLNVQPPHPLKAAQWGDSAAVQIGDPVIAIGNPLGVGLSVTAGIVSAVNRDIMETPYDNYIQTDAPINHGNSGGPLFNMQGEVIGINTALVSPTAAFSGLGFAMPSADARFVIGQLQRFGWLHPGWLGVKVQQVTDDMANALGMTKAEGAIVAYVIPAGPAAKAGVEVSDVVLEYNGRKPSDERALLRDIAETAPGATVSLTILRRGTMRNVMTTVAEWPRQTWERLVDQPVSTVKVAPVIPRDLGLTVGPLSSEQRVKLGLGPQQPGILITAVAPGSDASQRGLVAGDAILRVQDHEMQTADEYLPALDAARAQHRKFVLLLVRQQKQVRPGPEWLALQLEP